MRNEVTVDGVKLTREQVERAHAELNKPTPLEGGTRVWWDNRELVVLVGDARRAAEEYFERHFKLAPDHKRVILTDHDTIVRPPREKVELI